MTYCYSNESQTQTVERQYAMGYAPSRIRVDGVPFWRDIAAEHSEKKRVANAWVNHWSFGMGATTPRHADEIGTKCAVAGLDCKFDKHLRLKVNDAEHQRRLAKVVLGPEYHNRDSYRS